LALIKNNLVFGLSATAKLKRLVKHFDESWIKESIELIANNNIRFIEPDKEDIALVQQLTREKETIRNRGIEIVNYKGCGYNQLDRELKRLNGKHPQLFAQNHKFHSSRCKYFFEVLQWIIHQTEKGVVIKSHLIFLNSLKQLQKLFEAALETDRTSEWAEIFSVSIEENYSPKAFKIRYKNQSFWVAFIQSEQYAEMIHSPYGDKTSVEELFWKDEPVLYCTTYPSSANGVNLQFYASPESKKANIKEDFKAVHLLDTPHFYFGNDGASGSESIKSAKENAWYLLKLQSYYPTSEAQFKERLGVALQSGEKAKKKPDLNGWYKNLRKDYLLNQLAVYIQTIGRVERVKKGSPYKQIQYFGFSSDVRKEFLEYAQLEQLKEHRNSAAPYYSGTTQKILQSFKKTHSNSTTEYWQEQNARCEKQFKDFRSQFDSIRNGSNPEKQKELIDRWVKTRQQSLQHVLFDSELMNKWEAVLPTPRSEGLTVYFGVKQTNIFQNAKPIVFNLDRVYSVLRKSEEIQNHFEFKGYHLSWKLSMKTNVYAPYFYRHVHLAALGEEAIFALLKSKKVEVIYPYQYNPQLFELADWYLPKSKIFIDAKNWSPSTIAKSQIEDGDLSNQLNLEKKKANLLHKLKHLQHLVPGCRLFEINLYANEEHTASYWNENGKSCNLIKDAAIGFFPQALVNDTEEVIVESSSMMELYTFIEIETISK